MKKKLKNSLKRILREGWLLLLLFNVSLLTIGFANWTYGIKINSYLNFDANVGEVEDLNIFTNLSVTMFSLGPNGLVEDYTIVSSSSIKAVFYINNSLAYDITNEGSLSFNISLSCSDATFITTYIGNPTVTNSSSVQSSTTESTITSNVTFQINNNAGLTQVIVVYTVTDKVDDNGNYMADLYYSNKPTFSFSVEAS